MLNNIDLAERFINVAEKFIHIVKTQKPILDFGECEVIKTECGTIACHGGWALVALKPNLVSTSLWNSSDYDKGANELAKYLGFWGRIALERWAESNPKIWGSLHGDLMFTGCGHEAFNNNSDMTLADIASWYLDVAGRLLNAKN